MTNTKVKRMGGERATNGCDAVEVVTGSSSADEITLTNQWASELDLLASSGSDYHGWPNQRIHIGNLQNLPNSERAIWKDW
jgi:predicted metal-dependent phosphoesterase TrpH